MVQQPPLDFDRRDVLATADDDVLEPIADVDVAVRMNDRSIAAVEVAAAQRLRRRLGIVVVPLHHHVAADDDLADRQSITRHVVARLVDDAQVA